MNAIPGFERSDPKPQTPWATKVAVGLLVGGMISGLAVHFLSGIEWPASRGGETIAASGPSVENYTLFKIIEIEGGEVHTGYKFARSGDAAPFRQYCYAQAHREGSRIITQVDLAEKRPGSPVQYVPVSAEDAASLGFSLEEARQLALRHCRFRDEGGS